jgi:hypothetical protein
MHPRKGGPSPEKWRSAGYSPKRSFFVSFFRTVS